MARPGCDPSWSHLSRTTAYHGPEVTFTSAFPWTHASSGTNNDILNPPRHCQNSLQVRTRPHRSRYQDPSRWPRHTSVTRPGNGRGASSATVRSIVYSFLTQLPFPQRRRRIVKHPPPCGVRRELSTSPRPKLLLRNSQLAIGVDNLTCELHECFPCISVSILTIN